MSVIETRVKAQFPKKLKALFDANRFKILYGGRAGIKSWSVASSLVLRASTKKLEILCAREIQNSIDESVYKLLCIQIERHGLSHFYDIKKTEIVGKNGSRFCFEGLRTNIRNLKSYEDFDICWIEEANNVSKTSWDTLIPTIRKPGSEIIITFNPELDTDETYKRFVLEPPTGAWVVKTSYKDNKWLSRESEQDRLDCLARSEEDHDNIWEGNTRQTVDGAVFAAELRKAASDEPPRLTRVPYTRGVPVNTFWDLGWSDLVTVWFVQKVGLEYRIIDFLWGHQRTMESYVKQMQQKEYVYGTYWLPHDAEQSQLSAKGVSIHEQMRELVGADHVKIIPKLSIADQINAARSVFSSVWIDTTLCADGLQFLRHYKYEVDPDTQQFSKKPLHDDASHAGSSFQGFAVSVRLGPKTKTEVKLTKPRKKLHIRGSATGLNWLTR